MKCVSNDFSAAYHVVHAHAFVLTKEYFGIEVKNINIEAKRRKQNWQNYTI